MLVEVEKRNSSLFVIETSTKGVICHLPNITQRKDLPAVLKALSILLKGMSVELKKRKYSNGDVAKS